VRDATPFTPPAGGDARCGGLGELIELDAYRRRHDPDPDPPSGPGAALARIPAELDDADLEARQDLAA